jgi:3-hydroxyisobutyrate dehydrogenase-like beta-hydroxyacid dehydrogenase
MRLRRVAILHPGTMGAAVGAELRRRGLDVVWASDGRSDATAERAAWAGLTDARTLSAAVAASDVVFSICPPAAAVAVARGVGRFSGLYVDANAVSPATARAIAATVERPVDGGIVGPPPRDGATTRLYLSGADAAAVAELFDGTAVEARVVSAAIGDASALKLAYAAWTKGSAALVLAIRAVARANGVEEALLAEWRDSLPGLEERSQRAARSAGTKGWRWTAEMEEIAATFAAAGLPDGFHRAAAEVFRRAARADSEEIDTLLAALGCFS